MFTFTFRPTTDVGVSLTALAVDRQCRRLPAESEPHGSVPLWAPSLDCPFTFEPSAGSAPNVFRAARSATPTKDHGPPPFVSIRIPGYVPGVSFPRPARASLRNSTNPFGSRILIGGLVAVQSNTIAFVADRVQIIPLPEPAYRRITAPAAIAGGFDSAVDEVDDQLALVALCTPALPQPVAIAPIASRAARSRVDGRSRTEPPRRRGPLRGVL